VTDPIRARRAQIARLARLGQRLGYLLYGIAAIAFFVGLARQFDRPTARVIEVALIAGSVLLAPSIVASFAVRAAEREDREQGR
jgi:cation transporter-like permease